MTATDFAADNHYARHDGTDECRHENYWFSRVLCACSGMHHYCELCGEQLDPCG